MEKNEMTLKDVLIKFLDYKRFLFKKKYIILLFSLFCALLSFLYVFFGEEDYSAELTFVVEAENGVGAASSIAGFANQVGFDFAGVESSTFSHNNMLELLKSRVVIGNTLMQSAIVNGKMNLLIEHYLDVNNMKEEWDDMDGFRDFSFHQKIGRKHDSISGLVWSEIVENDLVIDLQVDEATIISLSYTSVSEDFAKEFVNTLIHEMSKMYISNRTARANNTLSFLQERADSVSRELGVAEQELARVKDINKRIIKASGRLQEIQLMRNVEVLQALYIEIIKNLEASKVTLLNQTPIINIIDRPILPIKKNQKSKRAAVFFGIFLGLFLSIFYFVFRKFVSDILKD